MSLEGPLDQTFGVEIECVAKVLLQEITGEALLSHRDRPSRRVIREAVTSRIYQALDMANIPVNDPRTGDATYERWTLDRDESISETDEDERNPNYVYVAMEIKSRILRPDAHGFEEARKVLHLVKGQFKLFTNLSCGLHIHCGNGGKCFPFITVRKLSQLVTALQPIIESLHSSARLDAFHCWANPPSSSDQLCQTNNPFGRLAVIAACQSDFALRNVFNNGEERSWAYNLQNLDFRNGLCWVKQTIEFRQHEGTVDEDEIVAWAEFVNGLVSFSHNISSAQLTQFLCTFSTDEAFNVLHLMQAIGKAHLVDHYRNKVQVRERPDVEIHKTKVHFLNKDWIRMVHGQ
ncbi:hypothetical protein MMC24_000039 [Lignoscripta atroalba]|nr:hypothetical protein [Lignoscripta atroalba]